MSARRPLVGDRAFHIEGLDPRRVVRVSPDGTQVWLDILGTTRGPFPAANYEFRPPHPVIARPNVVIANAITARRVARCAHCDWTYENSVKSDVEQQARHHRGQHRDGRTAVTR